MLISDWSSDVCSSDLPCASAVLHRHRPARRGAVPIGADDLAVEADALANMALVDDAIEIVEDRRAVGDRLLMLPRFEDETQCVHVAVRTDARITEKVPGAAKLFAALDEGEAMVGAIHLQMHGHADTRNARTDDQHILIDRCSLCVHGAFHRRRACHRLSPIYLWAQLTHRVAFCNRIDSLESKKIGRAHV